MDKDNLGKENDRRNTKKNKKKNYVIRDMNDEYVDYENEKKINLQDDIKYYQNMEYLSNKEKTDFNNKFSKPRNYSQNRLLNCLKNKNQKIVIATGPAGTGKTLFATEQGVHNFLRGDYIKLIFTRPTVSVDEELGFLPGTLEEKMAPWVRPIYDILYNFITVKCASGLLEEKIIEICPLGYMRGRTFKNCWIVADEMQNCTVSQMKMLLTRLGENSRLIITGDLDQCDRHSEINGLEDFLNKLKGRRSDSISSVEFDKCDIEREDVVKEVLDIYETSVIPQSYNLDDESSNESSNDSK
jgi:phosphate starvation-inducible PhoH-like protein